MERVFPVRAFSDNYIWVLHDAGERLAVVVDPGDARPVVDALDRRGMQLCAILTTHHHPDHVGGVEQLLARSDVPVYGPAGEHIPGRTQALAEGDRVELPELGVAFDVLDVPGHTAGHIAYVGDGMLFCGDTLFAGGCGRLFEGTAEQMHRSLGKFAALSGDTRVYCAHEYTLANLTFASHVEPENEALRQRLETVRAQRAGDEITLPSTIREELATNPFLRSEAETVRRNAQEHWGRQFSTPVDVFAAVRAWKDTF
jgi:hydroxyacylglutathione hydrolase